VVLLLVVLPPSTVLTPPELLSQSSCVTFPLLLSRFSISFSGGWIRVAEFSVFDAARFGSDLWFLLFSWFSGTNSGAFFFCFCFAAQEDFVFVLLLLLLLQGHDSCLVGSVGMFWKLKVQGR
jgi:hypothetical protein